MFLIILLYALFAASIVGSKFIIPFTKPIFLTGIRMFLGGIILLSYQYFHPKQEFKFQWKDAFIYLQLIIFGIVVAYSLRFWALESMPAYKLSFILNSSPFLTSLYSYLLFKEKLSVKQWLGLGIGFLGLIPLLLTTTPAEAHMGEFLFISWPEIAVLASAAATSYGWIIMRTLVKQKNYSPLMANGISMTSGGFLALCISPFFEGFMPVTNLFKFSLILCFIIVVSNLICHNLYGHLLRHHTATLLSFAGFMTPLFAALYEWALRGTKITTHFYISCVVVFIGLYLFYQDELRIKPMPIDEPAPEE
jgi:drug/metabolite transporter (DMT)-like permease